MRILVVSHMFPSTLSPDDVFIFNQVKALADQGVDVRVVQPLPWAPWPLRLRGKWRRYHQMAREAGWGGVAAERMAYLHPPSPGLQPLACYGLAVSLLRALRRIQRGFDFQLIHAHTLTPDGFASVWAGRKLGKPVVVSARGSDVHTYPRQGAWARHVARQAVRGADRVVAVSRKLAEETAEMSAGAVPVAVVYNGVDTRLFAPCADKAEARHALGLPVDGQLVLAVGSLGPEKGMVELIQAFGRLAQGRPEVRLAVLGGGPLRADLEALGARLGGGERVHLPGVVSNARVAAYMAAADLLVHPSHAEGLPNVVLEAMAAGLPVVATSVGGIPEVVVPDETGCLCEARDAGALERHLRRILDDPARAMEMGRAGRARVVARHGWDANARAHMDIYRELLGQHGQNSSV